MNLENKNLIKLKEKDDKEYIKLQRTQLRKDYRELYWEFRHIFDDPLENIKKKRLKFQNRYNKALKNVLLGE